MGGTTEECWDTDMAITRQNGQQVRSFYTCMGVCARVYVLSSYLQSELTKLQFSCGQVCVKPTSYSQQSQQILPRVPDVCD